MALARVAKKVVLSDYAPEVLRNCQHNVLLPENAVADAPAALAFELFDFAAADETEERLCKEADVIAAADVLSTPEMATQFAQFLARSVPLVEAAVVVRTRRSPEVARAFADACDEMGLERQVLPLDNVQPLFDLGEERERVTIDILSSTNVSLD